MEQLTHCRTLDKTILAIPDSAADGVLAAFAEEQGWTVFRGSEDDVLDRYVQAALAHGAKPGDGIVRLTGDDILPDPNLVDGIVLLFKAFGGRFDYVCTDKSGPTRPPRLPYGSGVELLSFNALKTAHEEAVEPREREHVVPFVKWNPVRFPSLELTTSVDLSNHISLSIDTPNDLARNAAVITALQQHKPPPYHLADILEVAAEVLEETS
ncbi:MAG: hypothetical protein A2516_08570 [Alphaproteobacteria bacterium RIFOXYD12_FULL_60_8]|nr:MAG: hypothetical protein A2516_08570 [Alphaproteobacteria bacterium RIFOXYD12_FULL_60_8]